ncbi:alpha-1A adrenergic receptor [Nematostella vectensis]|uniref:alpha-1A adrenergic receptor n=1 Tax=Nematostella vectensis TaxID=45351 RepID=UPI002076D9E5|nr:alpha-1A adrenergic receptor [Nematostella vectensis]
MMSNSTLSTREIGVVSMVWSPGRINAAVVGLTLAAVLIVMGNALVMYVILTTRELRKREANYFVVNLSFADCLVGMTVIPISVGVLLQPSNIIQHKNLRDFLGFAIFFFCICSIMSLTVLSLDRYFAITTPFRYIEVLTTRRAGMISSSVWIYSIVCALPPKFGVSSYACFIPNLDTCDFEDWSGSTKAVIFACLVLGLTYVLALTIMAFAYWKIFKVARTHARKIKGQNLVNPECKTTSFVQTRVFPKKSTGKGSSMLSKTQIGKSVMRTGASKSETRKNHLTVIHNPKRVQNNYQELKLESISGLENPSLNLENERIKMPQTQVLKSTDSIISTIEPSVFADGERINADARKRRRLSRDRQTDIRIAKGFLVVIGAYFVCWTPFCVGLAVDIVTREKRTDETLSLVFLWCGYANSLLNPVIYTWKYRQFRQALWKAWCNLIGKHQHRHHDVIGITNITKRH